jgi:hypothetical protein
VLPQKLKLSRHDKKRVHWYHRYWTGSALKLLKLVTLSHSQKNQTASLITDRLLGLAVGVLGYRTEMYLVSCEVRNEFIYVM